MESAVTQKDFELFKQEMKSDISLFKQEIRAEIKSAKDDITKDINKFIGNRLNFLIGIVIFFIVAYATYFEWTHNSINEINHQRAVLNLEESIKEVFKSQQEVYKTQMEKMGVKVLMEKEAIESLEKSGVFPKQKKLSSRGKKGL